MKLRGQVSKAFGRKKRPRHPLPAFIRQALKASALLDAYRSRPPYQQNDYIGWIVYAQRGESRAKRLNQVLGELKRSDRYMNGLPCFVEECKGRNAARWATPATLNCSKGIFDS
jgi:hypothetical protein